MTRTYFRRTQLCAMLLALLLLLTSCTQATSTTPSETLPPPSAPYDAPADFSGMVTAQRVALYLPDALGKTLLCRYQTIDLSLAEHPEEAVLNLLLSAEGDKETTALSAYGTIALASRNAVTTANQVCTVNLSSSVLSLELETLYTVCLSIATTLCALPEVQYVNILVAGYPIAMDIQNLLPLGTLSSAAGKDIASLWSQLTAQRTGAGGVAARTPLTSAAVLYFPLEDGSGLTCEVRQLSFDGQNMQQLVYGLLDALSAGAIGSAAASMIDIRSLLLMAPECTTLANGRHSVTFSLVPDALTRIAEVGIDPICFIAAVTCTLTSYIPLLERVIFSLGNTPLTVLTSTLHGTYNLPSGIASRADFASLLTDSAAGYVPNGRRLSYCALPISADSSLSPPVLLNTLWSRLSLTLDESDVLGASVTDDTLLISLSEHSAEVIRNAGNSQRLIAYSMVSTLAARYPVRRVRFFFGDQAIDFLSGDVLWSGEFMVDPSLLAE